MTSDIDGDGDATWATWHERLRAAGLNGKAVRLPASTLYSVLVDCERLLDSFDSGAEPPQAAAMAADLDLLVKGLPLKFV